MYLGIRAVDIRSKRMVITFEDWTYAVVSDISIKDMPTEKDWAINFYSRTGGLLIPYKKPIVSHTGNGPCLEIPAKDGNFIWISDDDGCGFPEENSWIVCMCDLKFDIISAFQC